MRQLDRSNLTDFDSIAWTGSEEHNSVEKTIEPQGTEHLVTDETTSDVGLFNACLHLTADNVDAVVAASATTVYVVDWLALFFAAKLWWGWHPTMVYEAPVILIPPYA